MERSKKGRQLLWYITMNRLMMRWFFALMVLFSAIIIALVSFEFIPTEFFDQLVFSWFFVFGTIYQYILSIDMRAFTSFGQLDLVEL